jgi:hypothetical protein
MKNILLIFLILIPNIIFSQLDYGLKFGVNLNNSSNISIISQDFDSNISKKDYDGYNLGGYISLQGLLMDDIEDRTTMGLNIGTRLYLRKIQFDIRYERGLNDMETKIINQNNLDIARIDSRKSLVSFGISFKVN